MERLMDTIIDVQEVQTELDRAARDAQTGSADVRAGRFVHEDVAKLTPTHDNSSAGSRRRKRACRP
jgi:hypothetical protein